MNIGLLFHAFVTAVVAVVAFILVYELFSKHLSHTMTAYGVFWLTTGLLWTQNAYRNAMLGFDVTDFPRFTSAVLSQTTVFITGVALYYYFGMKVFKSIRVARILSFGSLLFGLIGSWYLAQPEGVILEKVTFFTAEAVANPFSSLLFRIEIAGVMLVLIYDFVRQIINWLKTKSNDSFYELFYDSAIMLYVVLGAIDLAKIVTDWKLVIFRILYCAAFLTVYLSIRHQRETNKQYLFIPGSSQGGSNQTRAGD